MPVIHILNPQDPIPEVKSSSAILDGAEVLISNNPFTKNIITKGENANQEATSRGHGITYG